MTDLVDKNAMGNAIASLQQMVDVFNNSFAAWSKETGLVAEFSWGYGVNGCKRVEIVGVDLIAYRRPAPSAQTLREALEAGEPSEES